MRNVLKCFGAMSLVLLLLALDGSSSSAQAQYNPGPGFKISWALNPRADGNFRPVEYFGSSKVEVGMDFDRDGRREILFATDETLSPGGPGEGYLDLYLFEATGNDSYAHVWHYTTTEICNSFPAVTYGDIDSDGKWEIYFGVPTVAPSTNKLFIFEQNDSGVFADQPTLIWDYNREGALDFRPSGLKLVDVDKDGKIELISQSRTSGRRELIVAQLTGTSFDDFASFEIEFEAGNDILGGGGTYDVDVVDFDGDGKKEIWYNTWDLFSFEIFEADTANQYSLAVDLDKIFPNENDPGSFNRHDLFFNDIDGDGKLEAWFPMTDGKLYYLDNTDDVSTLTAANFTIVGTIQHSTVATGQTRGTDIGDIDRDGRWDIIVAGGTQEGIFRAEYLGSGSPKDSSNYEWTTILESVGTPTDYYYPLRISPVDLDGDGLREVVITNRYADDPSQPLILVLEYDPTTADKLADGWEQRNQIMHDEVDELYAKDNTGNSRTVIGGFDLDKDGKKEIIMNDYAAKAVRLFEFDGAADKFEMTWMSPPDTAAGVNRNASNPRVVTVGDLDGDDKWEIIFPLASQPSGWYVYEWDGVTGSDNYGTKYSSVINTEVDTCCSANRNSFSGQHEGIPYVLDVDKDGKNEILLSIRANATGGKRGLLVTSVEGDIEHNSGGSFETWKSEFFVDRGGYGGGSPYHAVPADLDGDGSYEIVNHTWNFFNFYNVDVIGPDAYQAPDPSSATRNFQATAPADQVSLFGGTAGDADGDGNDEAYFANYQTGDLWVVDYNPGDDVLSIDASHVVNVVPRFANFWTTIFDVDKNGRPNILSGGGFPRTIVSAELSGNNPRDPSAYTTKVIYAGEPDIFSGSNIVVKDSLGVITTSQSINGTFASKVQAEWNGQAIDFDNDDNYELIASFQSNQDSIVTLNLTWNVTANKYDTVRTAIKNQKSWAFQRFEFNGPSGVEEHEVSFVTPEHYVLEQNYPNPFNPSTTITYSLPLNKKVTLRIYDMMGRVVRTLVDDQMQSAGRYKVQWDGRNQHGTRVASGVYLYALEFGNFKKTKSMTLLK
ncbi:T9SS type A sorting domain-containing protein [candidate division KSB1 bacterium]|nr:T9SS type A sorting domain-containing protein [candidate division KSB1 bacterium]